MNYWSISSFDEHLFERSDKAWFLIVTSARQGIPTGDAAARAT
jgi:hypothetical protein